MTQGSIDTWTEQYERMKATASPIVFLYRQNSFIDQIVEATAVKAPGRTFAYAIPADREELTTQERTFISKLEEAIEAESARYPYDKIVTDETVRSMYATEGTELQTGITIGREIYLMLRKACDANNKEGAEEVLDSKAMEYSLRQIAKETAEKGIKTAALCTTRLEDHFFHYRTESGEEGTLRPMHRASWGKRESHEEAAAFTSRIFAEYGITTIVQHSYEPVSEDHIVIADRHLRPSSKDERTYLKQEGPIFRRGNSPFGGTDLIHPGEDESIIELVATDLAK